MPLIFNSNNSI